MSNGLLTKISRYLHLHRYLHRYYIDIIDNISLRVSEAERAQRALVALVTVREAGFFAGGAGDVRLGDDRLDGDGLLGGSKVVGGVVVGSRVVGIGDEARLGVGGGQETAQEHQAQSQGGDGGSHCNKSFAILSSRLFIDRIKV